MNFQINNLQNFINPISLIYLKNKSKQTDFLDKTTNFLVNENDTYLYCNGDNNITVSSKTFTCNNATFQTDKTVLNGDILVITIGAIVYYAQVSTVQNNTQLVIVSDFGIGNITAGNIKEFQIENAGTQPLNWYSDSLTTINNMFQYCYRYNQQTLFNMNLITNMTSMFAGNSLTTFTQFNNGQRYGKTSQPLYWKFNNVPTLSTNWRNNCLITSPGNNLNYFGPI